jgi:hypothetical protein
VCRAHGACVHVSGAWRRVCRAHGACVHVFEGLGTCIPLPTPHCTVPPTDLGEWDWSDEESDGGEVPPLHCIPYCRLGPYPLFLCHFWFCHFWF